MRNTYKKRQEKEEKIITVDLGFNWSPYNKELNRLTHRLSLLAETGVKWVKFQIVKPEMVPPEIRWMCFDSFAQVESIRNMCRARGLNPFFTPMFEEAVAWCGDDHIKIRYADRENKNLIRLASEKARNVWVSGLNVFCIPKYPSKRTDYIEDDGKEARWSLMEGVSFHCPDISLAMKHCYKNQFIEFHVKFSSQDYEAPWSIGLDDLKTLVDWSNK